MIEKAQIKNFKSIKNLNLDCKRVNIFIGKPNAGKSNILEAIGVFSAWYTQSIEPFVRFENTSNIFYDDNIENKIEIKLDHYHLSIHYKEGLFYIVFLYKKERIFSLQYNYQSKSAIQVFKEIKWPFKFYRFQPLKEYNKTEIDFLIPPDGANLLSIILTHNHIKKIFSNILNEFGLRLGLKPQSNKIEIIKEIEDVIVSYPYSILSDTLQRILYHLVAIERNKHSIIIFEEPESHSFPYYAKFLGERIAFDRSNQYFISTHNPYFLLAILEKVPKIDVTINITYLDNYQTKIKSLNDRQKEKILEYEFDAFLNIEHLQTG